MSGTGSGGGGGGAAAGSGAFAGAMAGMQFGAQLAAGYNAYEMQKLQNEYAREDALAAIQLDQELIIRRSNEEGRAYTQQNLDLQRRAMEAEATANVQIAEAGIDGITVDRLINNLKRQEAKISVRQKQTYESKQQALDDQFTRAAQTMVARMQGLTPPTEPNLMAITAQSFGPMLADSKAATEFDEWWGDFVS